MKRSTIRSHRPALLPVAWRDAEYAALQANARDTCDDRVSDDIFDIDDERSEVDLIVNRMQHDSN